MKISACIIRLDHVLLCMKKYKSLKATSFLHPTKQNSSLSFQLKKYNIFNEIWPILSSIVKVNSVFNIEIIPELFSIIIALVP